MLHFLVKCQYFVDIGETAEITIGQAEAEFFTVAQLLQVFFCDKTALLSGDGIGKEMQFALCRNARIELAQATCGGIARIGEGFVRFQPVVGLKRQNQL